MAMPQQPLLVRLGARIRHLRGQHGWARRELAARAGLSERFLAQLEAGTGNISLARFADVAAALEIPPHELLRPEAGEQPIALLGMRGAGKSTVGALLAKRLGRRFFELDRQIERLAELSLAQIFELHGEAYYRRLEHQALLELLRGAPCVFATGGSIVTDQSNFELVLKHCRSVWLRATAKQHWDRVMAQGDLRPMHNKPHAFTELSDLLAVRAPLYARAQLTIDTKRPADAVARHLASVVGAPHAR